MRAKILSPNQIEQFIACGYTRVEEAIPRKRALEAQEFLWERVEERGPKKQDPSTWTEPMVHIKETYSTDVFRACATERLADAVEDLVGWGRWRGRQETGQWGWWPVNFAVGADRRWGVPVVGWHWDGQHFRHFVDSPDQGLLLLCMFSEIGPRGGGTLVAEGSHQVVARLLNRRPEGWEHQEALKACPLAHPWLQELMGKTDAGETVPPPPEQREERIPKFMEQETVDEQGFRLRVIEIQASPGDVFLCHPFLYHAASQNHSGVPRFMCNRTTPLRERMQFQRADGDYSPVEVSIRNALAA